MKRIIITNCLSLVLFTSLCYAEQGNPLIRDHVTQKQQLSQDEQGQIDLSQLSPEKRKQLEQRMNMKPEERYYYVLSTVVMKLGLDEKVKDLSQGIQDQLNTLMKKEASKIAQAEDINELAKKFRSIKQSCKEGNQDCDNKLIAALLDYQTQYAYAVQVAQVKIISAHQKAITLYSNNPDVVAEREQIKSLINDILENQETN